MKKDLYSPHDHHSHAQVPTSTNALVELMNMVERWRQRTDYGPVVVVSQDGIGRWGVDRNNNKSS